MIDIESLTDGEIRMKLIEFGFPVMPITTTTRKLMKKKLRVLLDNQSKIATDNRRSLSRYSSEEENDSSDSERPKKSGNSRRATMAVPPMNPPPISSSSKLSSSGAARKVKKEKEREKVSGVGTKKEGRGGKMVAMVEEFDTGSDSEPEVVEVAMETTKKKIAGKAKSPIKSPVAEELAEKSPDRPQLSSRNMSRITSPMTVSSGGGDVEDRLSQIRSRLSLGNYVTPATSPSAYSPSDTTPLNDTDTPFLSNFTRKLSRLSTTSTPTSSDHTYKSPDVLNNDNYHNNSTYMRRYLSRSPNNNQQQQQQVSSSRHQYTVNNAGGGGVTTGGDGGGVNGGRSYGSVVSFAVIAMALLFFVVVTAVYLGLHHGNNTDLDTTGLNIPYCDVTVSPVTSLRHNCLSRDSDDVTAAMSIYSVLLPELSRRAVKFHCDNDNSVDDRHMTLDDVTRYLRNQGYAGYTGKEPLSAFLVLVKCNGGQKWNVGVDSAVNSDVNVNSDSKDNRESESIAATVYIINAVLPFTCTWYLRVMTVLRALCLLLVLAGSVYGAHNLYKQYRLRQQRHRDAVFLLVERIVDLLQHNTGAGVEGEGETNDYLVINHVRDMLLPINDRKRLEATWQEAVTFLADNESRVRTEIQVVAGEQCEVWRWLGGGGGGLNTSSTSQLSNTSQLQQQQQQQSPSWQGQAFETQAGSVNSLACSPTPCLKVRGMLGTTSSPTSSSSSSSSSSEGAAVARAAILSKCAMTSSSSSPDATCHLLHCAVSWSAGAIYLRAASHSDAALAYSALHGWWYGGHLVTVKYLPVERYMQRFPDAPSSGPPYLLLPATANSDMTTLSQQQ